MTVDWISAGRSRQLRMPGRTFFITALPLFVEVNSQIAFCPSGDDRYSRIISCPCGDARYVVIICFMGSYAKRCLLFFSGTFTCIQYKGKGRGYFLEKNGFEMISLPLIFQPVVQHHTACFNNRPEVFFRGLLVNSSFYVPYTMRNIFVPSRKSIKSSG